MAKLIINVGTRTEGSHKFFVVEDPTNNATTEIDFCRVPSALGESGVQFDHEFELALVNLAKLPHARSEYQFVLSDDACVLRDKVFETSELIFGDNVSEKAWNEALADK